LTNKRTKDFRGPAPGRKDNEGGGGEKKLMILGYKAREGKKWEYQEQGGRKRRRGGAGY